MLETPEPMPRKEQRVDLHCHSFGSPDGSGFPDTIAALLTQGGYKAFSLTDHRDFAAQSLAAKAAADHGLGYISGVEIGAEIDDPDLAVGGGQDLLCYGYALTPEVRALAHPRGYLLHTLDALREYLNAAHPELQLTASTFTAELHARYPEYADWPGIQREVFCELLIERGVLDPEEAVRLGVDVAVWRRNTPHKLIQQQGRRLRAAGQAIDTHATVSTVSRVMRAAGAVVILAHPAKGNRQPDAAERQRLHRWLDRHVDGIEVYHYHNSPEYRRMLLDICRDRGCLVTGGSDRHVHVAGHGPDSEAPADCLEGLPGCQPGG